MVNRLFSEESSSTRRAGPAAATAATRADPMQPPAPVTSTERPATAEANGEAASPASGETNRAY